jgi:hypothetical protein
MSEEWRLLDVFSERNPTRLLDYCETFTSPLMDPSAILASAASTANDRHRYREDSGRARDRRSRSPDLEHKDAVLIGTRYGSLLFSRSTQAAFVDEFPKLAHAYMYQ